MGEAVTHSLSAERDQRIAEKIRRELGPEICRNLADPDVIEIMLNPDGRLWVERLGRGMTPLGTMAAWQAEALISTVASTLRGEVTRESPILECELPMDGSRFEALIPPVVAAPVFTIRRKALKIFTLDDYVAPWNPVGRSARRDLHGHPRAPEYSSGGRHGLGQDHLDQCPDRRDRDLLSA